MFYTNTADIFMAFIYCYRHEMFVVLEFFLPASIKSLAFCSLLLIKVDLVADMRFACDTQMFLAFCLCY